jgi:hypothetical protein
MDASFSGGATNETPRAEGQAVKSEVSVPAVWIVRCFIAAACAYVVAAVVAVIAVSPRVPFADAWRHYARLLDTPFPASVFVADNGHPEVFANLVRLASLQWLRGDDDVQIGIGLALALASLGVLLGIVWRTRELPSSTRAVAAFVLSLGVFWLGNARVLLHDSESLHAYSVLLCLASAIALTLNQHTQSSGSLARVGAATVLCFSASFNFGSGVASFAMLLALLFMQRASLRSFLVVAAGLLLTLLCYRLLDGGSGASWSLHPVEQTGLALRWLAAPLIYLFWPFVDPVAAAALPHPFDGVGAIARAWTRLFGDVHGSAVPQMVAGLGLVFMVTRATLRVRRQRGESNDIERLGLALAWFGMGIAGLIALTRLDYFADHPLQLYAPRYLPWSNLAWAGLLTAAVAKRGSSRMSFVLVATVGVLALAAEGGMLKVMQHQREDAEDTALAAVVGVWPDESGRSENDPRDTRAGADALRRVAAGPFAWPEAASIAHEVPANARRVSVRWLDTETLLDETGPTGMRLQAVIAEPRCAGDRLLVVEGGRVVGLLRRRQDRQWRGVVRGVVPVESLQVFTQQCEGP